MRVINQEINFLSKGPKIPFKSSLKKPTGASKRDVLEIAILGYLKLSKKVTIYDVGIFKWGGVKKLTNLLTEGSIRKVVIEGMACQLPSR